MSGNLEINKKLLSLQREMQRNMDEKRYPILDEEENKIGHHEEFEKN